VILSGNLIPHVTTPYDERNFPPRTFKHNCISTNQRRISRLCRSGFYGESVLRLSRKRTEAILATAKEAARRKRLLAGTRRRVYAETIARTTNTRDSWLSRGKLSTRRIL